LDTHIRLDEGNIIPLWDLSSETRLSGSVDPVREQGFSASDPVEICDPPPGKTPMVDAELRPWLESRLLPSQVVETASDDKGDGSIAWLPMTRHESYGAVARTP